MIIKMRERRTEEMVKKDAENERKRLQNKEKKDAKDLTKTNAAENTPDLEIKEPEFMVGSLVKSKLKTFPGTNSNESKLVEGNIIYK